jgi:hypothetical protein
MARLRFSAFKPISGVVLLASSTFPPKTGMIHDAILMTKTTPVHNEIALRAENNLQQFSY